MELIRTIIVNTGIFPIPPLKGGGAEAHVYFLIKELAKLLPEVHCVSDISPGAKMPSNVHIHKVHAPPLSFQTNFFGWVLNHILGQSLAARALFSVLQREHFDIIHIHGKLTAMFFLRIRKMLLSRPWKVIYTVHDPTPYMCRYESMMEQSIRKLVYQIIEYPVWLSSDHIIVVSAALKEELMRRWNIPEEKISVIHNGVDIDYFYPHVGDEEVLKKYGISGDYFLFVGQLRPRKGVHYLLRALKGLATDAILVVVGGGPELIHLKKLTRRLGIEKKVIFTGPVPLQHLREIYASASFFVLPSVAEGTPLVVLEALASGLPVIATDIPGMREVVKDGCNGFIIPQRDFTALQRCIDFLLYDERLRLKMSRNARKMACDTFSWQVVAERTLDVYKKVLGQ
jgi:glycosyltransferase involved in cell wall biosynthesis